LTAACLICFTPSYVDWTSINVFNIVTNSESQFIGASRIVLPSTWWTDVCVRLTFPASAGHVTTSSQQIQSTIIPRCSSNGLELVSADSLRAQRLALTTLNRH